MDDDYIGIQAHICRARKRRNEAAGEILAAGWQQIKAVYISLLKKMQSGASARLRAQD